MKKKVLLFPLVLMFTLGGCNMENNNNVPQEQDPQKEEIDLDTYPTETLMLFPDVEMEVNQRFYIGDYLRFEEGSKILIKNENIVKCEGEYLVGLKVGKTYLLLNAGEKYQKVEVDVHREGYLESAFNISSLERGKKIVSFGDSVTANATIGSDLTYVRNLATTYGLNFVNNYAICGTTATYMFPGSNIDKEYHNLPTAPDGVRVVKQAYDNGELNDIDYAVIAYGHNDHYFQPPLEMEEEVPFDIASFDSAYSFKSSYRYMINVLRLANPNIKIIILNCTYSEYCFNGGAYGHKYTYEDYRRAQYEIAKEMDVKLIDPWNYMKTIFDGTSRKIYYKDVVHLTVKGHSKLSEYLAKF